MDDAVYVIDNQERLFISFFISYSLLNLSGFDSRRFFAFRFSMSFDNFLDKSGSAGVPERTAD